MNIAVLGAGSLGSAIGGTLALAGNEVTLIGRTAHVEAINASGLTLITPEGEQQAKMCIRDRPMKLSRVRFRTIARWAIRST